MLERNETLLNRVARVAILNGFSKRGFGADFRKAPILTEIAPPVMKTTRRAVVFASSTIGLRQQPSTNRIAMAHGQVAAVCIRSISRMTKIRRTSVRARSRDGARRWPNHCLNVWRGSKYFSRQSRRSIKESAQTSREPSTAMSTLRRCGSQRNFSVSPNNSLGRAAKVLCSRYSGAASCSWTRSIQSSCVLSRLWSDNPTELYRCCCSRAATRGSGPSRP